MRLDEWQKYLDAQFVDEEKGAKPVKDASVRTTPEKGTDAKKARQTSLPLGDDAWVPESPPVVLPAPEEKPAGPRLESRPDDAPQSDRPSIQAPRRRGLVTSEERALLEAPFPASLSQEKTETPAAPSTRPEIRRHPAAPETPRSQPFGPPPTLQADIPQFESYLPSTHAAIQAEADTPQERALLPEEAPAAPVTGQSSDMLTGAFSVLMPISTYPLRRPAAAPPAATPVPPEEDTAPESVNAPRRVPRSRARHARNVRPEYVPSGLSAADLWATVPRHVQTLLALGRMEEIEEEVAQSSYKRPFQETRKELIERLLDPILSLEDTARVLNVCPTTVRRYTNKGILTYYRKEPDRPTTGGNSEKETRQRRFRLSDILAFLETQQTALEADRQAERRSGVAPQMSAED